MSNSASSPAAWPSVRFSPRCCAQRPLPSITMATCAGMCRGDRGEWSRRGRYRRPTLLASRPVPWTAIVNPAAGRGRTRTSPARARATRARAAGAELHVSPEPGAPDQARASRPSRPAHDLVACGGDGLVTEVAGVAADTGAPARGRPDRRGQRLRPRARLRRRSARSTRSTRSRTATTASSISAGSTAAGTRASPHRASTRRQTAGPTPCRRLSGTTLYVAAVLRTLAIVHAAPVPPHRRRRGARSDAPGSWRSATAPRTRAACASRPTRSSTTACSTSPSSAR